AVFRADPISFRTTPSPVPLPRIELRVNEPDEVEPGPTLISLTDTDVSSWLVAVDGDGQIQWLFDSAPSPIAQAHPVSGPDGSGVRMLRDDVLEEIDWLGNVNRRLRPGVVFPWDREQTTTVQDGLLFTHEFTETGDGDWVTIDTEVRQIDDFPSSYLNPS